MRTVSGPIKIRQKKKRFPSVGSSPNLHSSEKTAGNHSRHNENLIFFSDITLQGSDLGSTEQYDELEESSDKRGLALVREFDCPSYNTCLGIAAALNWGSFTCQSCSGKTNQQLLWRAHHQVRKDKSLALFCKLPNPDKASREQVAIGKAAVTEQSGPTEIVDLPYQEDVAKYK